MLGKRQYIIETDMLQLEPHSSNYRGCSHATDKMQKGKSHGGPKTTTGRIFSSSHTIPGLSLGEVLCSNTE
jgi:hypothetical protein